MEIWLYWIIVGVIFFIIEIFTPVLFFLSLAIASLIVAGIVYLTDIHYAVQILIWGTLSAIFVSLRFLIIKKLPKDEPAGTYASYIGKEAKTIKPTGKTDGRITIYGEDWYARSLDGSEIEENTIVKIVKYDNLIFYVERLEV